MPKPKTTVESTGAQMPAQTKTDTSTQSLSQSPVNQSASPPEKTSMWVTLAGMKCH